MYFEKPLGCAVVARTVENYHLCLSQYILYLTTLGIFSVPQICTRIPELHSVPQICRRISEFQCLWETQLARNLRTQLQEQQGQCLQITHLRNRIPKLKGAAEQGGVTHRMAKDMRFLPLQMYKLYCAMTRVNVNLHTSLKPCKRQENLAYDQQTQLVVGRFSCVIHQYIRNKQLERKSLKTTNLSIF